ncbi:MAG: hydroxymethylglutaryl-CoA lyase [Alphaproteobacteria bacterium]|nr:hydroxymethylglutaryl-CoA lyase [Alphaproteobacteria bacterium]
MPTVKIVEVGPRDGLQNEKTPIPVAEKLAFIKRLAESGLKHIELTSFVRPDAIPQLADAEELAKLALADPALAGVRLSCLVPNMKGMEKAVALGVKEVALFVSATEGFSKKNINATIAEAHARQVPVAQAAAAAGIRIRGYLSCVFGCPYDGAVSLAQVEEGVGRLKELGVYEVSLGDTIGVATPRAVEDVVKVVSRVVPMEQIALHFHDTRGMALVNAYAGWQAGVRVFDASAGGLGGCPYARGASGNVATEDMVYLFESLGLQVGVDVHALAAASEPVFAVLGRKSASKLHGILTA